jgi:hypothetical protein
MLRPPRSIEPTLPFFLHRYLFPILHRLFPPAVQFPRHHPRNPIRLTPLRGSRALGQPRRSLHARSHPRRPIMALGGWVGRDSGVVMGEDLIHRWLPHAAGSGVIHSHPSCVCCAGRPAASQNLRWGDHLGNQARDHREGGTHRVATQRAVVKPRRERERERERERGRSVTRCSLFLWLVG